MNCIITDMLQIIRIQPFYCKTLISSAKNHVLIACAQVIQLTSRYN